MGWKYTVQWKSKKSVPNSIIDPTTENWKINFFAIRWKFSALLIKLLVCVYSVCQFLYFNWTNFLYLICFLFELRRFFNTFHSDLCLKFKFSPPSFEISSLAKNQINRNGERVIRKKQFCFICRSNIEITNDCVLAFIFAEAQIFVLKSFLFMTINGLLMGFRKKIQL